MNRKYRKVVIAGNWKMNKTPTQAREFARDFKRLAPKGRWCEIVICPPAVTIPAAVRAFKDTRVAIDAQNVFCVGERQQQRELGTAFEIIATQVKTAISTLAKTQVRKVIIAYEPLWAIGTGVNAQPEQAQEICEHIRAIIRKTFDARVARAVPILYGGSMNPSNAADLLAQPDVDGGLIGGASLNAEDFIEIIKAANQPAR